jgi:anti-anti-sigma factor
MDNIKNEINYNELVNPTFTTGQATLEMLAAAGNPDAIAYKEILSLDGATKKVSANSGDASQIFSPEEGRALMMGVTLGIEARYAAVSRLLKESGYKSMLDIASGYTPRALMCRKEGIDYIGLDLPAVVDKMAPLAEKLLASEKHSTYVAGDATNAASIKAAADQLDGELFITCEGLLTYLNKSELEQTIQGIRQILLEHGGAWYSSDMGVMYDHFSAVAINKPDVLQRWAKIMSSIKKETDVYFFPASFPTAEEKIAFFEKQGLRVELVPFYTEDTRLNILYGFDAEGQQRMKHLMNTFYIWKMTAVENENAGTRQVAAGLDIRYQCQADTLMVSLDGRLDTLSAPELMKLLDTLSNQESFGKLVIDLEKLEYLSSTGLRIFLMMAKRLGGENVYVDNANALVRDIFETTGFAEVVVVR